MTMLPMLMVLLALYRIYGVLLFDQTHLLTELKHNSSITSIAHNSHYFPEYILVFKFLIPDGRTSLSCGAARKHQTASHTEVFPVRFDYFDGTNYSTMRSTQFHTHITQFLEQTEG